ncbi:MAG: hypothetical protein OXI01_14480 [Albidovulum sp.]|nr:hypothetical protein [Albidovulum sp.]
MAGRRNSGKGEEKSGGNGCAETTLVIRRSSLTGKVGGRAIPASAAEIAGWMALGNPAPHVQEAFPDLNANDREFLMNGSTPEEFEELIGTDHKNK